MSPDYTSPRSMVKSHTPFALKCNFQVDIKLSILPIQTWKNTMCQSHVLHIELFFNSLRLTDAYICISKLTIIVSDNGLSHTRCQAIIWTNAVIFVNWTPRNKPQGSFNCNSHIFIQENVFQNVFCEMASIVSQPQGVNICTLLPFTHCG